MRSTTPAHPFSTLLAAALVCASSVASAAAGDEPGADAGAPAGPLDLGALTPPPPPPSSPQGPAEPESWVERRGDVVCVVTRSESGSVAEDCRTERGSYSGTPWPSRAKEPATEPAGSLDPAPQRRAPLRPTAVARHRASSPERMPASRPAGVSQRRETPAAVEPERPMPTLTFADRFGPTLTVNAAPLAVADGPSSVGTSGLAVSAGARFSLRERRAERVSFVPTASLLVRAEGLGTPSRMGLGLEARVGAGASRPLRGLFPFIELYALTGLGFAGNLFAPQEARLRLGAGLQLNFYAFLTESYTVGDLANAFMGAIGGYFRFLFRGGGWGSGGGGAAGVAVLLVGLVAALVVPPLVILAGMLVTFGAMAANVELAWTPSLDGRNAAVTELRLGLGF